jgi:HEAT repeat protein
VGFGIKIAPGVRIRASSRGFSAGIGPRAARVHVGTRGVGVSSGVGPVSGYAHLGGGRRSARSGRSYGGGGGYGPSRSTLAALERASRQAEKQAEIDSVRTIERQLVMVHTETFAVARPIQLTPPSAPDRAPIRDRLKRELGVTKLEAQLDGGFGPPRADPPAPVDVEAIRASERQERFDGISFFKRAERRVARQEADQRAEVLAGEEESRRAAATATRQRELDAQWEELRRQRAVVEERTEAEAARQHSEALAEHRAAQEGRDQEWQLLAGNDPTTVLTALEQAFADNGAPATPIDCEGATATVTMLYGHPDLIPERTPAVTPGGKPTLRKRSKTDRNELYLTSMASNVLATVKEGFAVCPGLEEIAILVVRREPQPGGEALAAIYAGTFSCDYVAGLSWGSLDPAVELESPEDHYFELKGQAATVAPLDLRDEPELQGVLGTLAGVLGLPAQAVKARRARSPQGPATPARGGRGDQEVLVRRLASSDADQRYDAVQRLRERRDPALFEAFRAATRDLDGFVRREAAGAIADLGGAEAKEVLTGLARHSDADVRYEAMVGLAQMRDPSLRRVFVDATEDGDRFVRRTAVDALGQLVDEEVEPILIARAGDTDADVRYAAVAALASSPSAASGPVLEAATRDGDVYVRQMAADGLGSLQDARYSTAVASLLDDRNADVRYAAVGAVARIGPEEARDLLRRARSDSDRDVRELAAIELERMTGTGHD